MATWNVSDKIKQLLERYSSPVKSAIPSKQVASPKRTLFQQFAASRVGRGISNVQENFYSAQNPAGIKQPFQNFATNLKILSDPKQQQVWQKGFNVNNPLQLGAAALTGNWSAPVAQIPANLNTLMFKKASLGEKGKAGLGALGGVVSLIPDPTDIAFPAFNYFKGTAQAKRQGLSGEEARLRGRQNLATQNYTGLGDVFTDNSTLATIGNFLEIPAALFAGYKGNKAMADGAVLNSLTKKLQSLNPGIDPKAAKQTASEFMKTEGRYIRNQFGQFAKRGQNLQLKPAASEPVYYSQLRQSLGYLKDETGNIRVNWYNPQTGKMEFMTASEWGKQAKSSGGFARIPDLDKISRGAVKKIEEFKFKKTQKVWNNENFVEEVNRVSDAVQRGTPVNKKVNILDYFRTPDRVLQKIGLEQEAKILRTQWNKYQTELPQEINRIAEWRKRVSPESNQRIFQYLDGKPVKLQTDELLVANEIKAYLKEWAVKLNLPEEKQISNYITHIFERTKEGQEFPDEIASLIKGKVPGSVYDPFLQKRMGKPDYIEDTWRALDAYTKRAVRKYNIDPALEKIKAKSKGLEDSQINYLTNLTERINLRPTQLDNLIDNFIKSTPIGYKFTNRPTAFISRAWRQIIYRGTLGGNIASAVKNLTQGANTYAVLGERYTIKGYMDMLKNWNSDELKRVGVLQDSFIQDQTIYSMKRWLDKLDDGLFYLFSNVEKINRGAAYYGAKAKALARGKSEKEAIAHGLEIVRKTQFTFGSIDTPLVLQSDIAKTLGQFQSYSLKQTEFLGEMLKAKDFAGLTRWTGASLAMIYAVGDLIGMEPADLIPFNPLNNKVAGPPPVLQLPTEIVKAALNTPDRFGQPRTTKEKLLDIGKSAVPYVPAGTQIKKTFEGVNAYRQGASTSASGRVRYPIEQTPGNAVRTGIFGQYSGKEAREYFDSRTTPLSETQTAKFKASGNSREYYNTVITRRKRSAALDKQITSFDDLNKKIKALATAGDSEGVRNLVVSNKDVIARGKVLKSFKSRYEKLYESLEKMYANPKISPAQKAKIAEAINKQIETLDKSYVAYTKR